MERLPLGLPHQPWSQLPSPLKPGQQFRLRTGRLPS